jgi:hypothetical protein
MTASDTRHAARGAPRGLSLGDWAIVIGGTLVLVASFLPWETATASTVVGGYSGSDSAWNAGFAAWFGSLLCAGAAGAAVARRFGYTMGIRGVGPNLIVAGLAAGGAVLLVIRLLTLPHGSSGAVLGTAGLGSYGPGFGAYTGAALAVTQTVAAVLTLRASGERLPPLGAAAGTRAAQPGRPAPQGDASQPGRGMPFSPAVQSFPPAGPPPAVQSFPPAGPPPSPPSPAPAASSPLTAPSAALAPPGGFATPPGAFTAQPAQPDEDTELVQRLSRLDSLRSHGMITDSEYAEQRRRIISQL